ncbi:translation initiation factor IF-2 subunit beta [Candidatus Micrarchaeota archaeon]|nr:translation initiation factor IF-2 subunit beta [Candidatus Micrarchaeota archaeon]
MEYNQLLDNLYEKLPKKTSSGERFEKPIADTFFQGTKTIIRNFDEICRTIRRKPEEFAKYLFKELATPGSIEGARLTLQTKVYPKLLNEKISNYVDQSVICNECGKPDTHVEYGQPVNTLICEACGARRPIRL